MNLFVFLMILAGITLAYSQVLKHWGMKGLTCARTFSRDAVFEGEDAELVEVVSNDRPLLMPWLRVESRIPAGIRLGRMENLEVSGDMYHSSLFTLMPYQRIRRRHKVHFLHRGAYDLGNAAMTVGDVLGQTQLTVEQRMHVPVLVYPRLLEDHQLPEPVSEIMGEMVVERRLQSDPFLTRGIRPYLIGDPVRDIHWPATARVGQAQVRVHDYTTDARPLVLLNAQTSEAQWDNLMDYEQGPIEHEIRMTATLCVRLLHAGLAAGFGCNMPMEENGDSTLILPRGGREQEEDLLAAFARLRVKRTKKFNTFLQELDVTGLDLVVLSPYDSEELQAQLAVLRERGNRVALCVTEEVTAHAE